ncbi:MAG TPA: hypothetical protein P5293_01060 [Bacteroidales bacterium]|nr:hypothetical protein [Bacteroidales bacterium]
MFDDLFDDLIQKKKAPEVKQPEPEQDNPFGEYFDTGMGDTHDDVWSSGQLPDYWKTK